MTEDSSGIFTLKITKDQAKDSGMAAILILLLIGLITKHIIYFEIAVGLLLIDMLFPMFFYPFAIIWFGLSRILGIVVSKVLLSVIYVIMVLPVALTRQLMGKDPLLLKAFKKSNKSVMKTRNHVYETADLERPF